MTTEHTPKPCPQCGRFVGRTGVCEPCQTGAQLGTFSGAVGFLFGSPCAAPPAHAPRARSVEEILRGE
jgi:hypothetical protein